MTPQPLGKVAPLLVLLCLAACGGGGGAPAGGGRVGGSLVLPGGALARAAKAAPARTESEPNDLALQPDLLGDLRAGDVLEIAGEVGIAPGDLRDVLRLRLPERCRLAVRLDAAPRADGADRPFLALLDPTARVRVGDVRSGTEVASVAKGLLDLVVEGAGTWALRLHAEAAPPEVEVGRDDVVFAGETLPGDRLTLSGTGRSQVRVSTPIRQRLRLTSAEPLAVAAAGGALRVVPGEAAWLECPAGSVAALTVLEAASPAWRLEVESRLPEPGPAGASALLVADEPVDPADAASAAGRLRAGQALLLPRADAREALRARLAAEGVEVRDEIPDGAWLVDVAVAGADEAQRTARTVARTLALSRLDGVERCEPNHRRRRLAVPNDPRYGEQWHYPLLRLPEAWDLTTGSASVTVAVIDTGVTAHPDLEGRSDGGYDFVSDAGNANDGDGRDGDPTDPGDGSGGAPPSWHGTHVAGTVGARTDNGRGVAGVTWGCRLMHLRVLGVDGGDDFDIANAIRYAAGLTNASGRLPSRRAHVINMSLGGGDANATLADAVAAARAAGVTVVAAAGNESTSQRSYPAAFEGVIAVGAVDRNAALASYSNTGTWVDCVAPGGDSTARAADGVLSTLLDDAGTSYTYAFYDGTSMASPHVAGVAALVLSVAPALTPDEVEGVLLATARDLGAPGRDTTYGAGLIDARAAVERATGGTPPPPPPPPPGGGTPPPPAGETVYVLLLDATTEETLAQVDVRTSAGTGFELRDVATGAYLLVAGTDRDDDGWLGGPGELYGAWPTSEAPEPIVLATGESRLGLLLPLAGEPTTSARRARLRR